MTGALPFSECSERMPFCYAKKPMAKSQNLMERSDKSPFVNVAIKGRAEQVNLFCRAEATKRSEANLKGDLGGM